MPLRLDEDPTIGVEWEWRELAAPLVEVDYGTLAPGASLTRTLVLRHDSEDPVRIVGFHLSPVGNLRDHRPTQADWDRTPARDVEDLLRWADEYDAGLFAVQDAVVTRFRAGVGSSVVRPLPCTLGAGANGVVQPGEEVSLGLRLDIPAGLPRAVFMNLEVALSYRRIV